MSYHHILAALSLDEHGPIVLAKAAAFARQQNARLSAIHVVEYVPMETGEALIAMPADLTQQLTQQARDQLQSLCAQQGLGADAAHVANGAVSREIARCVEELSADLIVVGHHPRRGLLARLFSHTDQDVVQKAPCDVLVVALANGND